MNSLILKHGHLLPIMDHERLCDGLRQNCCLRKLDISDNCLTHLGAQHIANALKINSSLRSIDLSTNAAGPKGAFFIARALMSNNTLRCLSIVGNHIGCTFDGSGTHIVSGAAASVPAPAGPTAIDGPSTYVTPHIQSERVNG